GRGGLAPEQHRLQRARHLAVDLVAGDLEELLLHRGNTGDVALDVESTERPDGGGRQPVELFPDGDVGAVEDCPAAVVGDALDGLFSGRLVDVADGDSGARRG